MQTLLQTVHGYKQRVSKKNHFYHNLLFSPHKSYVGSVSVRRGPYWQRKVKRRLYEQHIKGKAECFNSCTHEFPVLHYSNYQKGRSGSYKNELRRNKKRHSPTLLEWVGLVGTQLTPGSPKGTTTETGWYGGTTFSIVDPQYFYQNWNISGTVLGQLGTQTPYMNLSTTESSGLGEEKEEWAVKSNALSWRRTPSLET